MPSINHPVIMRFKVWGNRWMSRLEDQNVRLAAREDAMFSYDVSFNNALVDMFARMNPTLDYSQFPVAPTLPVFPPSDQEDERDEEVDQQGEDSIATNSTLAAARFVVSEEVELEVNRGMSRLEDHNVRFAARQDAFFSFNVSFKNALVDMFARMNPTLDYSQFPVAPTLPVFPPSDQEDESDEEVDQQGKDSMASDSTPAADRCVVSQEVVLEVNRWISRLDDHIVRFAARQDVIFFYNVSFNNALVDMFVTGPALSFEGPKADNNKMGFFRIAIKIGIKNEELLLNKRASIQKNTKYNNRLF